MKKFFYKLSRHILFWLSSAATAGAWLYVTGKMGWTGLASAVLITICTMVSMGCQLSLRISKETKNEQPERTIQQ